MFKNLDLTKLSSILLAILTIFLLTRIALFFTAIKVKAPIIGYRMYDRKDEIAYYGKFGTLFHGWDSDWYLNIATNGYPKIESNTVSYSQQSVYAFFPLYPLLSKLVGFFVASNIFGAIIVSNLALLISGFLIFYLTKEVLGEIYGMLIVKYLFIFPTTFLFSAIQTESLFLCLLLTFFLALEKKRVILAGVLGYFLALTKPFGFLVFIPILYSSLKSKNKFSIIYSFLPILGILTFLFYSFIKTGDLFIALNNQQGWGKFVNLNPSILITSFKNITRPQFNHLNITLPLFIFLSALFGTKNLDFSYKYIVWLFILVHVITTTQNWHFYSYLRYVSILFPAFFTFSFFARKNWIIDISLSSFFIILNIVIIRLWVNGFPVAM